MKRLVALVLILVIAHNVQSRREQDALRRCVTEAQGDLKHLLDKAASAEDYAAPQLATDPRLESLVTDTVAKELPLLLADRRACDFRVLPWHGEERDAYLAYLDARLVQLEEATRDYQALHADPAAGARAAAQQALRPVGLTVTP